MRLLVTCVSSSKTAEPIEIALLFGVLWPKAQGTLYQVGTRIPFPRRRCNFGGHTTCVRLSLLDRGEQKFLINGLLFLSTFIILINVTRNVEKKTRYFASRRSDVARLTVGVFTVSHDNWYWRRENYSESVSGLRG